MKTVISTYEKELIHQTNRQKTTVELIKIVSDLWFDNAIELVMFRNSLIDQNVSEILKLHGYAATFVNKPISIFDSVEIAKAISLINLPPSKLDIGKLTYEYHQNHQSDESINAFISKRLNSAHLMNNITPKDVVLFGFGRIGRLIARELLSKTGKGNQLRLRAVVVREKLNKNALEKRAALIKNDSIHGGFKGSVLIDPKKQSIIINGTTVQFISAQSPEEVDYSKYDIKKALLIDNTGVYRDDVALSRHLNAKGIEKVLLTAPGNNIPNIVYGVNHKDLDPDEIIISSAASCTTNAIAPILKVIEESYGIEQGHLETIHAYTNDQNLVDNMHSKYRRGRAAALNMVITETGAGKAVSKAVPSLEGKLSSNAIRVPIPNGSLAILNLELKSKTTVKSLTNIVKKYALQGDMVEQIKFEDNDELVSSDIIGSSAPAIFDSKATIVKNKGKSIVLYIWYDNEYGYSHQVIRLAKFIAKVRRFTYY